MTIIERIGAHMDAWRAFQSADGREAIRAEDREAEALTILLNTTANGLDDLTALSRHLAWYLDEEAEQASGQARAFYTALQLTLPAVDKAKALLDAVDFDNNGVVVAGHMQGGNGGLLSRETTKAADDLRRALGEVSL